MHGNASYIAPYTANEERLHSITHSIGLLLSIVGLVCLLYIASLHTGYLAWTAYSIYGASLIFMYASSTLYHATSQPKYKQLFRKIDHAAIFLLIAGTYTPFALLNLFDQNGISLFITIWVLAIVGIFFEVATLGKYKKLSVALYVGMGWLAIVAFKPLLNTVASPGIILLALGGITYTLGIIFYVWKSLAFHHVIWHIFVLIASVFHFFSILLYTMPANTILTLH